MDLATLGLRIESQEAEVADKRLDDFAASAAKAESEVDRLAASARGTNVAVSSMNVAVRQQTTALTAVRGSMGLTTQEGLNLSRQFADIGVSAAMGMNPLMILIQQGPQIADIFQTASMRGVGFSAALRGMVASAGPVLAILGPIAIAVGLVAAGFGLLHRELSKGYPTDITDGLGLTEEQLKRVEDRTVTFGDTFAATFSVLGRYIMESPIGDALRWLGDFFGDVMDWITKIVVQATAQQVGLFVGAYRTIVGSWRLFPQVIGEFIIEAANFTAHAVETMVNGVIRTLNFLSSVGVLQLPKIPELNIPELENKYAGAGAALGKAYGDNVNQAYAETMSAFAKFGDDVQAEAIRRAQARAREQAGDPNKGRSAGKSDAEREYDRLVKQSENFLATLKNETAEIGLNVIQRKMLGVEAAAAIAPTRQLADAIRAAGVAWREAMIRDIRGEAMQDLREESGAMRDHMAMLELEADLIGASNEERARQLSMLQKELDLRARAAQIKRATGVDVDLVNSIEGQRAIADAGDAARQAEVLDRTRRAATGLEDGLVSIITRTKTVSGAFKDMANEIIADLVRIWVRQQLVAPIMNGMRSGAGLLSSIGSAFGIGSSANGSEGSDGNWMWTGENGPELVKLPRGADVVPAEPSRRMVERQAMEVNVKLDVNPSPYFDTRVREVAAPLAQEAAIVGAQAGAEIAEQRLGLRARNRIPGRG